MSLKVEEILHHEKSKYQDILVFKSETYGNVLVLDGVIQVTTRDEFAYQEMIAHLPLFSHPDPRNVLIVGGGDGGVVREVLKHPSVESVILCEIDSKVIDVSKQFLSGLSSSFADERVNVKIMDGALYMEENPGRFDVIIVDSSDPVGPAESLFKEPFYRAMERSLSSGGIACCQGECMWLHLKLIGSMMESTRKIFQSVEYAYTCIPTYPSGQIGFVICGKGEDFKTRSLRNPARLPTDKLQAALRYYNSAIHTAAFVLPEFAKTFLIDKL